MELFPGLRHGGWAPREVREAAEKQYSSSSLNVMGRTIAREGYGDRAIYDDIGDVVGEHAGKVVVDFGTGNGTFPIGLAAADDTETGYYVGIESSAAMVDVANEIIEKRGLTNVRMLQANAKNVPLEDESADIVTALFVMYHEQNPWALAREAKRILAEGGKAVFATRGVGDLGKAWDLAGEAPEYFREKDPKRFAHTKPPKSFYGYCGLERTKKILDRLFERDEPEGVDYDSSEYAASSETALHFPASGWRDYERVVIGILDLIKPDLTASEKKEFIAARVKPKFDAEVEEHGYFTDTAKQYILAYKKPANPKFNAMDAFGDAVHKLRKKKMTMQQQEAEIFGTAISTQSIGRLALPGFLRKKS